MSKSKSKPQTIADLKINWTFEPEYKGIDTGRETFKSLNPSLNYKIKKDLYTFLVSDYNFRIQLGNYDNNSIDSFIEQVDYEFRLNYKCDLFVLPKKLLKFELVEENTFRIHLEEVTKK